jgi:hypothetical protein
MDLVGLLDSDFKWTCFYLLACPDLLFLFDLLRGVYAKAGGREVRGRGWRRWVGEDELLKTTGGTNGVVAVLAFVTKRGGVGGCGVCVVSSAGLPAAWRGVSGVMWGQKIHARTTPCTHLHMTVPRFWYAMGS